jgi:peroxiredoxin
MAGPIDFELVNEVTSQMWTSTDKHVPIVIEFYFAGCTACQANAENVKSLATKFHGAKAQVVELSIDCEADVYSQWINAHSPFWPVLNGCERDLPNKLGIRSYPTTVVLNAQHEMVYRTVGVWSSQTRQRIETHLKGE